MSIARRGTRWSKLRSVRWGGFSQLGPVGLGMGGDGAWGRGKYFSELQDSKVTFTDT